MLLISWQSKCCYFSTFWLLPDVLEIKCRWPRVHLFALVVLNVSVVSKISFTGQCCVHTLIKNIMLSEKVLFVYVGFGDEVWCTTKLQRTSLAMQTGDIDMFVTPVLWQTGSALASSVEIISNGSGTFADFVWFSCSKRGFDLQNILIWFLF